MICASTTTLAVCLASASVSSISECPCNEDDNKDDEPETSQTSSCDQPVSADAPHLTSVWELEPGGKFDFISWGVRAKIKAELLPGLPSGLGKKRRRRSASYLTAP